MQPEPPKPPSRLLGYLKKPVGLVLAAVAIALILVIMCCCGLWAAGTLNRGSV
ncbi:hypothetical protein Cs7R123_38030 [Catellatospora sp. TT07R-123]|uniref:hypothetical protein n=1 Tax=Catellatospora sp. TT07R-123 TaxID=2733863 RepID=UPI001B24DE57|nr:hypothetical protein [Catellatospora sp. TT07R-123]GHJ46461.1 hypothetical protein Cs7R123_38030 [Catellatospora sp. TT07R-123]